MGRDVTPELWLQGQDEMSRENTPQDIVERYDQGREEGAGIDEEDPKNQIYHSTDR